MKRASAVVLLFVALLVASCRKSKPPEARPADRSCAIDAECVPAPACCPEPCSSDVVNYREVARLRDELRCDRKEQCPSAGSCVEHAVLCLDGGVCALVFRGDEAFRRRQPRD